MPRKRKFENLIGHIFYDLTVISLEGLSKWNNAKWKCKCICGKETIIRAGDLKSGNTKSCGCRKKKVSGRPIIHGLFGTHRYALYNWAQQRAKKKNLVFTITATDIPEVPNFCPILGIPLFRGKGAGGMTANSPTLDRIIPSLGYIPGNLQVISQRANVIKNDASFEEIEKVANYMKNLRN